jgi:MoaD family protein
LKVEVLYFAELKEITGKDKESFNLNHSELLELINALFKKYNSVKKLIWDENKNKLKKNVSFVLNDEIVNQSNKLSIELSEGDKIAFLLPISGG